MRMQLFSTIRGRVQGVMFRDFIQRKAQSLSLVGTVQNRPDASVEVVAVGEEENLKKLFEPFFSTKIGKGGTGLGMTIVQNLVSKSLGGTVTVTSTVGLGTTFSIDLPLVLPEQAAAVTTT